jgi:A/G-specific adenine glycosylase
MECGALICTPRNPACDICPVRDQCLAFVTNRVDALPRPKEKKPTRELRIPLYIVVDVRGRVLMRRESGPLMNAMYHLPHGNTSLLGGQPFEARRGDLLGTFRHTVTDRRITFDVYAAEAAGRVRESAEECSWIDVATMSAVPHPSYVQKALKIAKLAPCAGV